MVAEGGEVMDKISLNNSLGRGACITAGAFLYDPRNTTQKPL
jgi:hypothetical protein